MKKSPLIAAIIGALALLLQQFVIEKQYDIKVVLLALVIGAVGAASVYLKGKGTSLLGILGTVGYTFYSIYQDGHFTWNQFIVTSLFAVVMLFSPTILPQKDTSGDQ